MALKIHFGQDSFLIHTGETHIHIGEGPSPMDVEIEATIRPGKEEKIELKNATAYTGKGITVQLPDVTISYLEAKETDVLILQKADEKLIKKIKPKLVVLMNSDVYKARELHQKTNIQTISVIPGTTIDLSDYNALAEQKTLGKFTTTK